MSLDLDARQQAMLAEMGVRCWALPAVAEAALEAPAARVRPVQAAVNVAAPAVERSPAPSPQAVKAPTPLAAGAAVRGRPEGVATMDWPALRAAVAGCEACALCEGRHNTVFGVGDTQADWLVVGEAPGEQEDQTGEPFVGQAGKLLDNMLKAIGLDRQRKVFIANVLKCRPPGNRNPLPQEVAQCEPYLRRQVELLRPKIILAMGRFAVQSLLQSTEPIGKLRGRVHQYQGVPVVVTYHPAYLLRSLPDKARAWADLCLALEQMRAG